jgi:hypothetical protein
MERSNHISLSNRTFLRIPGLADEHAGTSLTIDGLTCSIDDCISLLLHNDLAICTRALNILAEVSSAARSEAHAIAGAMHRVSSIPDTSIAQLAESSLCRFISSNLASPEIVSIGAQWVKTWDPTSPLSPAKSKLISELKEVIVKIRFEGTPQSTNQIVEARHVLCRSFEAEHLRAAAAEAIHAILCDETPSLARDRRVFAEQFLSLFRSMPHMSANYTTLRRIASAVFTTGMATPMKPASSRVVATNVAPSASQNRGVESSELSPQARLLIDNLIAERGGEFVSRLVANDYEMIRKAQGLSLQEFRTLTNRIRSRAASDPWARAALLDLVRAPHEPAVSSSVRTAVLGGLVTEARKLGRLSSQIEKEVFAISAEIPALPFLQGHDTPESDGETSQS